jgi:hypothetical protein
MDEQPMGGVIDRFEGDVAVVVLDDGQQLRWPRVNLPPQCTAGTAVRLSLAVAGDQAIEQRAGREVRRPSSGAAATLPARLTRAPQGNRWVLNFKDGSLLYWPTGAEVAARAADTAVTIELRPDAEDTAARRGRVSGLLDDIFGTPGPDQP